MMFTSITTTLKHVLVRYAWYIVSAGATSNLVTFQVGDLSDNYTATVVIRISDIFGDYTEIEYNIRVSWSGMT